MNASDTNQVLFSKKLSTGSKKLSAGVLSQIRWHLTRWQPILLGLVLGLLGWQSGLSIGYAANELAALKATEQTIKQHSGAFAKAYNAGNAAAIAHLFTAKGEFIDVQQTVYQGPAAIEEEFVASFQTAPGSMIEIQVDPARSRWRTGRKH